jgi:RNA polymerase sigma-70 factor (ECF subfamily)
MALTDNELIARIRGGDRQSFSLLVDRYKDRGMTLAMRILKNREDAEESLQDAFVRAFGALGKFEGHAKFATWFYRIVYNVCLTKLGQQKRRRETLDVDPEPAELEDIGGLDPHEILESKDMLGVLQKIIARLPERYASIVSLFYFQELSYDEICGVSGLPIGTVKTHLFRARAMIQKRLGEELRLVGSASVR